MYHYRKSDGSESDSIDLAALIDLARSGEVSEETPVRENSGEWKQAWRLEELQLVFGLAVPAAPPAPETTPPASTEKHPQQAAAVPIPPQLPRRASQIRVGHVLALAILIGTCAAVARRSLAATTLTTRDGRMQLTVAPGWAVRSPDPGLELQADTDGRETVILAGSVPIDPDEGPMSLEAFDHALIQAPANESPDFEDLGTQTYSANGLDFLRHDFKGTLNGRSGRFILVSTKTREAFYRLVAATSAERAEQRKPDLESVLLTFRPK
jgi:hypothetical protein